jgi:SRSO17 transposase
VGVARQYAGITGQVENCQTVVFAAYVTPRGHAPFDFRLYLPKSWFRGRARRERARVPARTTFATKPALAAAMVTAAARARVLFSWVAGDEVYGRSGRLRQACEKAGKGYVLAVPVNFAVRLPSGREAAVSSVAAMVPAAAWETRSCGPGCKGRRDYRWAWAATASPRHWLLVRRSLADPADLAFYYCHVPQGRSATLTVLVTVTGKRWPAEECHQQGKGQTGLDQHQVRLWCSFCRHTVLSMCAQALLAVAAAHPAPAPLPDGTLAAGRAGQPPAWRDTGKLPATPADRPPADPGMVKVSVPEARRLARLAAAPMTHAAREAGYAWSRWRRRHQARARWHHYHARLKAAAHPP